MKQHSEAAFQQQVLNLATLYDWSSFHAPDNKPDSRGRKQRVAPGFPDLVLVRGEELIFAELKTETGKLRPAQRDWLAKLENVPGIDVYLWRPSDFDQINARLSQGRYRLERAA